jgi:hypothetical protein
MTSAEFRRLALSFSETVEGSHMAHPDFRVGGKIFATLDYPKKGWSMVKLPPADQKRFVESTPDIFVPAKGKWGEGGATCVLLKSARKTTVRKALEIAWSRTAPQAGRVRTPRRAAG